MSPHKLWSLPLLATMIGLMPTLRISLQPREPSAASPIWLQDKAKGDAPSLRYSSGPSKEPRLGDWLQANDAIPPTVFLPIQSRDPKELGAGKLLVASRKLGDPNFAETVVLLVHYDSEGVVGLIVNRRTTVPISRVLEQLKDAKDRSDPVYLGGPVETPAVFALLESAKKIEGAEHVFGKVYLISKKEIFEQTVSARPGPGVFHVYLGYAGWTAEQLRMEVELGAWFIFQGDARTVFNSNPDSVWSQMIEKTELKLARTGSGDAEAVQALR